MNLPSLKLGFAVMLILLLAVTVLLPLPVFAMKPVPTGSKTFIYPKIKGYFVDRCLYWGKQCDGQAAQKFCRLKGYDRAGQFRWAYKRPTLILGSGQVCNIKNGCGAISRVQCVRGSTGSKSGRIVARITRSAFGCKEAGKIGGKYVKCQVEFSLQNTTGKTIQWSSGKHQTAWGPSTKPDRRSIGYLHPIKPNEKMLFRYDCKIPKGSGRGVMSAWGSGRHHGDANKDRFKWKIAIDCP